MRRLAILAMLLAAPAFGEPGATIDTNKLSTVPVVLIRPIPVRKVVWCILEGGAAEEVVIFRAVGGTPEYQRVTVPANAPLTVRLGQNVNANNGLEVVTADAAGDVSVLCTVKVK